MSAKYGEIYPNLALMDRFPVKIINTKYLFTMVAPQFSNHQYDKIMTLVSVS